MILNIKPQKNFTKHLTFIVKNVIIISVKRNMSGEIDISSLILDIVKLNEDINFIPLNGNSRHQILLVNIEGETQTYSKCKSLPHIFFKNF